MTKKYIVTNCPCFNEGHPDLRFSGECLDLTQDENDCCSECTDCLIKQVVNKCKQELYDEESWYHRRFFAEEILQLFTIEEVE